MITFLTTLLLTVPVSHPHAAPVVTSLTNPDVSYSVSQQDYVILKNDAAEAIIVNNAAVDIPELPGHRAGYNGLASYQLHGKKQNLFVPTYAGLNFEHIHDGTLTVDQDRFEPRHYPMELRIINESTVEVYQAPTKNWKLESCGRYELLEDGAIEYTFECIPREDCFKNKYMGFFWASYIQSPEDRKIYFQGHESSQETRWIEAFSEKHGFQSTHPPEWARKDWKVDPNFSLTLVNHLSDYVYDEPWYYGISHEQAFLQVFRKKNHIWFAQSPTGGGNTNPAWDFQWFVADYKVGQAYGFVMRAALLPTVSREEISKKAHFHLEAIEP